MFCINDTILSITLLLLVAFIIYLVYQLINPQQTIKSVIQQTPDTNKKTDDEPSLPVFTGIPPEPSLRYNKPIQNLHNIYTPQNIQEIYPVSFTPGGEFGKRGVIALRNVDKPYQDLTTMFQRVGTCYSDSTQDDTILTLYRRDVMPERDFYEYKVVDHTNGNNLEIYLNTNITNLRNGDRITIPGYENKSPFVVNLDRQFNYIRLNPF